jgi:hypothetical protein
MLARADYSVGDAERILAPLGVTASYLAPTPTALEKSIIDATEGVRACLRTSGIHDYDTQEQGPEHKRIVDTDVFSRGVHRRVRTSLYRPATKDGDPRLWVQGLRECVAAHNLLAIVPTKESLLVINMSDPATRRDLAQHNSLLRGMMSPVIRQHDGFGAAVVDALGEVAAKGWVDAFRQGSTAVGMTVERELGITPNSSQAPDLHGFEIKAKVVEGQAIDRISVSTRHTLFAKVPDWDISEMKSSKDIVVRYGYPGTRASERIRLYCTVSADAPNSNGLQFHVDESSGVLVESFVSPTAGTQPVARWRRQSLEDKLEEKHRQTAWVFANERECAGTRQFRVIGVRLTWKPRTAALMNLLRAGIVTMDHLIKQRSNGQVSEKGPLFKIGPSDFSLLFPNEISHALG